MTLILTSICKNGVCACSDTRHVYDTGKRLFKDGFPKIIKFEKSNFFISHHGINEINDKSWINYCGEYMKTDRWKFKNLMEITEDFKIFIELDVSNNFKNNDGQLIAFLFCGKTLYDNEYRVHELYWNHKFEIQTWSNPRIIGSGIGFTKYLEPPAYKSIIDGIKWDKMNILQAEKQLVKLFNCAVDRKNRNNGAEFSDDFLCESVTE